MVTKWYILLPGERKLEIESKVLRNSGVGRGGEQRLVALEVVVE